jgi:putative ABC transport system permease protein
MTGPQVEAFLRGLPGAKHVTAVRHLEIAVAGITDKVELAAHRGDSGSLGYRILAGRWFSGAGEAVVGTGLLKLTGKSVGDPLTLYLGDRAVTVTIVGEMFGDEENIMVDETTVPPSGDDSLREPDPVMYQYFVGLEDGVTAREFIDRVAGGANAGLVASTPDDDGIGLLELVIVVGTLTALLLVVAGLGVAHTVVLNTRERRRDLAITKAVGMTPGQVIIMAVTSMAALGLVGGALGLPGGVAAQRATIRLIGESEETGLPQSIVDVYSGLELGGLLLCGVVIAVLGALIPARKAARIVTAEALHTE